MDNYVGPYVTVRQMPYSTLHLVSAGGGPADGSLWGFRTLCGRKLDNEWQESMRGNLICKVCRRTKVGSILQIGDPAWRAAREE